MRVRYYFSSRRTGRALAENSNQHRVPFPRLAKEVIRISDIILEVLDARFIKKTRNKEMEELVKSLGKVLIYVLNKADLIDFSGIDKNELKEIFPYVLYSCKSKFGRTKLRTLMKIIVKREKFAKKHTKAHIGVIGYPNTGKSSLINSIAGGSRAGTSAKSGFTRGIQKIRFNKDILILDTPGVFEENENVEANSGDLKKQAEIGIRTADSVKNPEFVVHKLMQENPGVFEKYYGIESGKDSEVLIEKLGRKLGFITKGNLVNRDKSARYMLKDWQTKKIR